MGMDSVFLGLTIMEALLCDENRHSYLSDNPYDDILFEEYCRMENKNDSESKEETC